LVPGERTTISIEMAEYAVGKRISHRFAELSATAAPEGGRSPTTFPFEEFETQAFVRYTHSTP
jgi:hypothetical protein